ncbi:N-methylhydantoinase A [Candidatus Pantoea symbiotica]|jgi:N-methylhydantoinase A|uniref:N-methylhydantoinase A n=1 Tax=Candidatus Pantoea symbiotica TaxID=1884370 RepID=A0A1I3Z0Q7_9GAMM|nr:MULTISPECIES: hydantoinase/oxoprolinase family protein [Pantoea]KAJ9430600.1 hydantoinase/oxoprolinase family protein [Pantoea sp. YR343]SFK37066.1 N-methylhydantoinase A [Pantoea symbiotica]SFU88142.1 N-methylhydantoinase A [Pantoea sp. YR525]
MKNASPWRIGFDIGGTFTDLVLLNDITGEAIRHKTLTTPEDPSEGAYTGLTQLVELAGLKASDIHTITHGTTLAINALLERRGAKTAFVVTRGFRDVLVLGREYRYDIYDLNGAPAQPLLPRSQSYEISERVTARGEVITPLDEAEVVRLAAELRDQGYEAVAVLCMHAYAWPEHENRIEAIFSRELPGVSISVSHKVSREIREYDRGVLTAMNAFVQPKARRYMARLETKLREGGFTCDWLVMGSNGGLMAPQVAADYPTRIIESGPAGGIVATAAFARKNAERQVLAFDMGGTTAKACVVRDGEPSITIDYEVGRADRLLKGSGLPVKLPVVDMIEIGAGGGSIARVDSLGLLEIGPESASAWPGPACYARGGEQPTVTDANLVLGLLDPDAFLGGRMPLDVEAARQAIRRIAEPLGLSIEDAAWGIHEVANSKMSEALRTHSVEKNVSPSQMTMLAFGGAGPSHAWSLAKQLSVKRVYFPNGAGVYSAFGLLTAPPSADFVRSDRCRLQPGIDVKRIAALFAEGFDEAITTLAAANADPNTAIQQKLAGVRYVGQGSELTVTLPESFLAQGDIQALIDSFEAAHLARFGRTLPGQGVEVVNWRGRVQTTPPVLNTTDQLSHPEPDAREKSLQVYLGREQGFSACRVIPRSLLITGEAIHGPALLQEKECAIYVGPGASAQLDAQGNILMELN